MNSIHEAIIVYWISLSYIHVGTLEHIWRVCYNILWKGILEEKGYAWVNWIKYLFLRISVNGISKTYLALTKAFATKDTYRII